MSQQALPRVALCLHRCPIPSRAPGFRWPLPHLWPNLSTETQTQIAQHLRGADAADAADPRRGQEGRSLMLIAPTPLTSGSRRRIVPSWPMSTCGNRR